MMLSVIIPVYCVEQTLDRCIESVKGQTFSDLEIILVDDGSPDSCPQRCDEWAERDSRIHVIHQPNNGLSAARNAGIDKARGDCITFVDSDDYLDTDTYRRLMPLMEQADIVEFPLYRFYGSQRQHVVNFQDRDYTDMEEYWLKEHAYEHCYAWNKVYRRTLFGQTRFPVGEVFEDTATLPLLLAKAQRLTTTTQGMYYYCANDKGITATASGKELNMLLENHLKILPHWCDSRYYMHVINIQLDVCRLTGRQPAIVPRRINPLAAKLSITQRLKALIIDTLGFNTLCKLNRRKYRS